MRARARHAFTALTRRAGSGWLPTINAGSLLLKPNKKLLAHMLELAPTFRYNAVFAEQALLNAYWARDLTILPYLYNGQVCVRVPPFPAVTADDGAAGN